MTTYDYEELELRYGSQLAHVWPCSGGVALVVFACGLGCRRRFVAVETRSVGALLSRLAWLRASLPRFPRPASPEEPYGLAWLVRNNAVVDDILEY